MSYETLILEKEEGIATITMNRPDRLNALSFKLKEELSHAFDALETDDEVKVVILTGGPKAFSAGADIKERSTVQMAQPRMFFNQRKVAWGSMKRRMSHAEQTRSIHKPCRVAHNRR